MSSKDNKPSKSSRTSSNNKSQNHKPQTSSSSSSSSARHVSSSPSIKTNTGNNNTTTTTTTSRNKSNNNNINNEKKINNIKQKPPISCSGSSSSSKTSSSNQSKSVFGTTSSSSSSSSNKSLLKNNNSNNAKIKNKSNEYSNIRDKQLIILNKFEEKNNIESLNSNEMATTNELNLNREENDKLIETNVDESSKSNNLIILNEINNSSSSSYSNKSLKNNNNNNSSQKKDVDISNEQSLPNGWEQHVDKDGPYFWHIQTGIIQRNRPIKELSPSKDSVLICHDDEEIINIADEQQFSPTPTPSTSTILNKNKKSNFLLANNNNNNNNNSDSDNNNIDLEFEDDEYYDLSGTAALTIADDTTTTTTTSAAVKSVSASIADIDDAGPSTSSSATIMNDDTSLESFIVYPLGCCEFDETQLVSISSTKAIQKCILKLSNKPINDDEIVCWGLTQQQPVLLRLFNDYIQFTDINNRILLRSQPIQTIKTWAVDDDNNFAFVIEDRPEQLLLSSSLSFNNNNSYFKSNTDEHDDELDYALLNEPTLICYVFHSIDDDDQMSCKVASKLNEQINRYREQLSNRISKSTRVQQMRIVEQQPLRLKLLSSFNGNNNDNDDNSTDIDEDFFNDNDNDNNRTNSNANANANDDDDDELEANNEMTMNVKYIGKTSVPRPTGIEILNVAIDKCLAEASKAQLNKSIAMQQQQQQQQQNEDEDESNNSISNLEEPLIEAKLHVSPSSVIVENTNTGEIIVECRIRFLTFMGISKRDIRWCGFIMQNSTNKSFVAHCFECYPTAGHVCEAIQLSCSKMYEKVIKNSTLRHKQENEVNEIPETISIIPSKSKIRNTLAKTLLRIRLNPLVSNLN